MRPCVWAGILMVVCLWIDLPAEGGQVEAELEPQKAPERETRFFAYVGQFSATRFNQIIRLDTDFQSSWVGVLGINRDLVIFDRYARLEGEVNFGQHWGMQNHQEVNAGVLARWMRSPWDPLFDTSFALGSGISYASQRPPIEEKTDRRPAFWLKYLVAEIEGARPNWDGWSAFVRIHHRSGVFGLVSDARGSNFVGLGVRRRF